MSACAPSGARSGERQAHHAAQVREQVPDIRCGRADGVRLRVGDLVLDQLGGRVGCRAGHERPVE
jgi:hypothetical protein